MRIQSPIVDFASEQRELWNRVNELWELSKGRDQNQLRAALHPGYVGWDMNAPVPHDREAAVLSVSGDSPELREYRLHPLSVQVYDGQVGVVHYSYSAIVLPEDAAPISITGKWSEVYLMRDGAWAMISVSGRPDDAEEGDRRGSA
jgi:hypothetical protein